MLSPTELQRQTLRLYGELVCRQESWAGKLIFTCGPQSSATGLAAAVSIVGGTSLVVDSDAATVKSVFRQGGVDFVVNTLDEALRVLKNEIRKQKPLSVALIADVQPVIGEMTERGVLPDMYIEINDVGLFSLAAKEFLHLSADGEYLLQSDGASQWLKEHNFLDSVLAVADISELRDLDERLLQIVPASDSGRLQWLRRISHYQRPRAAAGRVVWLTPQELQIISSRAASPGSH